MSIGPTGAPEMEPFAAFLALVLSSELPPADAAAKAFANHLASVDPAKLPKAARPLWQALITRLLKTRADKGRVPPAVIAGIASWPQTRVAELVAAVQAIESEIARAANDRLADETNERVSKSYL